MIFCIPNLPVKFLCLTFLPLFCLLSSELLTPGYLQYWPFYSFAQSIAYVVMDYKTIVCVAPNEKPQVVKMFVYAVYPLLVALLQKWS